MIGRNQCSFSFVFISGLFHFRNYLKIFVCSSETLRIFQDSLSFVSSFYVFFLESFSSSELVRVLKYFFGSWDFFQRSLEVLQILWHSFDVLLYSNNILGLLQFL